MSLRERRKMIRAMRQALRTQGLPPDMMLTDIQYRRKVQAVRLKGARE